MLRRSEGETEMPEETTKQKLVFYTTGSIDETRTYNHTYRGGKDYMSLGSKVSQDYLVGVLNNRLGEKNFEFILSGTGHLCKLLNERKKSPEISDKIAGIIIPLTFEEQENNILYRLLTETINRRDIQNVGSFVKIDTALKNPSEVIKLEELFYKVHKIRLFNSISPILGLLDENLKLDGGVTKYNLAEVIPNIRNIYDLWVWKNEEEWLKSIGVVKPPANLD